MSEKICRLCGAEIIVSNRVKSHILTKSSYLVGGQEYAVSGNGKVVDAMKQVREQNLLCRSCDGKIGRWEDERQKFLQSSATVFQGDQDAQPILVSRGFNAEYIVLACLADLFRSSICSFDLYARISLGNKHEERIADILRAGKIVNFSEYPVSFGRFSEEKTVLNEIAIIPAKTRCGIGDGIRINYYRCMMPGGWQWMVRVDRRPFTPLDRFAIADVGAIPIINIGNYGNTDLPQIALHCAHLVVNHKR